MSRAGKSTHEVEVKIRISDPASIRKLLRRNGYLVIKRRVFEANTVFDTPDGALRTSRQLLRVRRAGSERLLTYKGKPIAGKHKTREEIEVNLSDTEVFASILERLGFKPSFRYEKFRTEFAIPNTSGLILLDETPVGDFLELEGTPAWIDRTARKLGYSDQDYITSSYASLYFTDCSARGVAPTHMVFPTTRR